MREEGKGHPLPRAYQGTRHSAEHLCTPYLSCHPQQPPGQALSSPFTDAETEVKDCPEDTQLGGWKSHIHAPVPLPHLGAGTSWVGWAPTGELPGTGRRTGCPGGSGERTISFTSEAEGLDSARNKDGWEVRELARDSGMQDS